MDALPQLLIVLVLLRHHTLLSGLKTGASIRVRYWLQPNDLFLVLNLGVAIC